MLVILLLAAMACSAVAALALMVMANNHRHRNRANNTGTNGPSNIDTGGDGGNAGNGGTFPAKVFSPYWDTSNESVKWQSCPAKFITLAFVLGDSSGTPMWNGTQPISAKAGLVNSIRSAGKDVIVSFGGQAGTELGQVITDVNKLAAAYTSVVEALDLTWIDLDIEGGTTSDTAAVTRRHKAIAKVQKAKPGLIVSYTLPVMPSGLPDAEVTFLKLAKDNGVRVDVVNIMAMDYGDSFKSNMGQYAIDAATKTRSQLQGIGLSNTKIGICPMIGVNDVQAEVFTVANARAVREFAQKTSWVRWLSFWSINRDNDSNVPGELYRSSGIKQKNWDFSSEFAKFA